MTTHDTEIDYRAATDAGRDVWSSGDFNEIARQTMAIAEDLCRAADPRPGQAVLDVACGSGNVALIAARRCCDVTGIDIAANLIGVALIVAAIALLRSQRRAALAGGRAPAPEPDETAEAPQAQSTVSSSPSSCPSPSSSRAPSSRASSSSVLSGTTTVTLPAARSISGTASRVKGT